MKSFKEGRVTSVLRNLKVDCGRRSYFRSRPFRSSALVGGRPPLFRDRSRRLVRFCLTFREFVRLSKPKKHVEFMSDRS